MELWQISAVGLGRLVAEGWASSRQIVHAHLNRVAAVDSNVNAVAEMRAEHALAEADEAARAVRASGRRSAVRGVPFMVRRTSDLADAARTPGIPVQAPPAPRPLAPVDRLRGLGAVPIGRTTTADWAFHRGAAGTTFRATVNPWDANRTPGESGDAAAVATGMTPLAVGGDDGGALRLAAQACGVTTLRCTRRRIPAGSPSSFGAPSLALQLFTAHGFTARRVDDLTAAVHAAAVRDPGDPWNSNVPLAGPAWPRRVAVTVDPAGLGVDADVARAVQLAADALADAGYHVEEANLPNTEQAVSTWAALVATEARVNPLAWYDRMSPHPQPADDDLVATPPGLHRDHYAQALAHRHDQERTWAQLQQQYPIILGPVSTTQPAAIGRDLTGAAAATEKTTEDMQTTPLLAASTMLDLPVVVTPVAVINGLPQAVHIAAPPWREDIALAAAHDIEQRLGILTPINPTTQQHNDPSADPSLHLQPTR